MYHVHTFGSIRNHAPNASKRTHVVHSVGFRKLLVLGRFTLYEFGVSYNMCHMHVGFDQYNELILGRVFL